MAADKQLIIVVEGTALLGMHWSTIISDYLEKIVREFCGRESMKQVKTCNANEVNYELQLVMFLAHGSYGPMRSGWTRHMDNFLDNLKIIQFVGGSLDDAATTDGLADALMMFAVPPNGFMTEENLVGKRHCILVAGSNPFPLPVPVHRPNFDTCGDPSPCHDAETVAGWFGKCSVSLSVICPRKLPKIRALYEAGKRNSNSEDPPVQHQHPNYLVLISEDFKEAQDALNSTMLLVKQEPLSMSHPQAGAYTTNPPGTSNVKDTEVSSSLATEIETNVSSIDLLQPSSNLQGNTNIEMGQMNSNMNPVNAQHEGSLGMNLATTMDHSSTDVAFSSESSVLGMPAPSIPTIQGFPGYSMDNSKYKMAWEGNLFCLRFGNPVFITRLKAYINSGVSAAVVGWPDSITITRLITQARVNHEYSVGKAVLLVFNVMDPHDFIRMMLAKKLSAVITLSTQILVLTVSEQPTHIIGMLFPLGVDTSSPSPAATRAELGAASAAAAAPQRQRG